VAHDPLDVADVVVVAAGAPVPGEQRLEHLLGGSVASDVALPRDAELELTPSHPTQCAMLVAIDDRTRHARTNERR